MSITAENRSFKYGDGLFETIRVVRGFPLFLKDHFDRLQTGLTVLGIQTPGDFSPQWLQNIITDHVNQYANVPARRIRITFWRAPGGLYSPTNHQLEYYIESSPLSKEKYQLNTKGLQAGIYTAIRLQYSIISGLKTTSALPYVLAGKHRLENNLDECILYNTDDHLVEGVATNIFYKKGTTIYTTPLSSGCVDGVMRKNLIRFIKDSPFHLTIQPILLNDLDDAEEVWMCNTIQGIRWLGTNISNHSKRYTNKTARYFVHQLNEYVHSQIEQKTHK